MSPAGVELETVKNGKLVRYRYTDKKKSTKKLVAVSKKKKNTRRKK